MYILTIIALGLLGTILALIFIIIGGTHKGHDRKQAFKDVTRLKFWKSPEIKLIIFMWYLISCFIAFTNFILS